MKMCLFSFRTNRNFSPTEDPREGRRAGSTLNAHETEDLGTTSQFVSELALDLFYIKHNYIEIWYSEDDVWKNLHNSSIFLI